MSYTEKIGNKLNELLEKNYDAEAGYKQAADQVGNNSLKEYFNARAKNRYDFGHQLKAEMKTFGVEPDKGTSLKGDAHRTWINLKSTFTSDKDEAVLEETIRGEKSFIDEYDEVINNENLPASTKNILVSQRNSVVDALETARAFEMMA
ncbi:MAG: PA2169 family four-helix-bundle protein [Leeuwenhoekiella sp.]